MSERGVFAVDRGIWDHPIFADEPLTEREAWQWLISEAAFRSRKKRVGNTVFDLERGQLAVSLRFMAEAWQWKKDKVARFLARLKSETMIETQARHDATVITVCKYNVYQKVSLPSVEQTATASETRTRHERDKLGDNKNIESVVVAADRASGSLVTPEALHLTEKLLVIAKHDPAFWPPSWGTAALRVQTWLNQGWPPEIIVAKATAVMARTHAPPHSVQFFEKAIAGEIARQSSPLPVVEIKPAEKVTVSNGPVQTNSVSAVAKRWAERFESESGDNFEGHPSTFLRLSSG